MVSGLQDDQVISVNDVHQSVLFIDSARPRPGEVLAQSLGFADAFERTWEDVIEQPVDSFQHDPVLGGPVRVVRPCALVKDQSHQTAAGPLSSSLSIRSC